MVQIVAVGFVFAALWSVLCRINLMQHGRTRLRVFVQHAALGLGLAASLLVPDQYAHAALAAGVCAFLALGAHRWRDGAPSGVLRPDPLDPLTWPPIEKDAA